MATQSAGNTQLPIPRGPAAEVLKTVRRLPDYCRNDFDHEDSFRFAVSGRRGGRKSHFYGQLEYRDDGFHIRLGDANDPAFWVEIIIDPSQFSVGDSATVEDYRHVNR